jgi:hypothetical protein
VRFEKSHKKTDLVGFELVSVELKKSGGTGQHNQSGDSLVAGDNSSPLLETTPRSVWRHGAVVMCRSARLPTILHRLSRGLPAGFL